MAFNSQKDQKLKGYDLALELNQASIAESEKEEDKSNQKAPHIEAKKNEIKSKIFQWIPKNFRK